MKTYKSSSPKAGDHIVLVISKNVPARNKRTEVSVPTQHGKLNYLGGPRHQRSRKAESAVTQKRELIVGRYCGVGDKLLAFCSTEDPE